MDIYIIFNTFWFAWKCFIIANLKRQHQPTTLFLKAFTMNSSSNPLNPVQVNSKLFISSLLIGQDLGLQKDIFAWLTTMFTLTCYIDLWWLPCSVPIQYSAESILCLSLVPLFLPGLGSIDRSISSFEQLANGCLGNKLPRIHKSWAWCVHNPSIWGAEVGV